MEQILVRGSHDYDYNKEDKTHKLYYSNNAEWMSPEELCMEIIDDGNGLTVMVDGGRLVYLDYSTAEMLTVLLKLINRKDTYEVVTKRERI